MEFTRIQHKDTHEVIQYRIDGQRVSQNKYDLEKFKGRDKQYHSSYTDRTRNGNYRHSHSLT